MDGFTPDDLRSKLARHCGVEAVQIERVPRGLGTMNWLATTSVGRLFLKAYPIEANLTREETGLRLGEYARDHGIPTPAVLRTRKGELICAECGFSVFEYIGNSISGGPLSPAQMAEAGRVLGRIHGLFQNFAFPGPSQ